MSKTDIPSTDPASAERPFRILWANRHCLLDTSSGASLSALQMLHQLNSRGMQVDILGATNFDNPSGALRFQPQIMDARRRRQRSFVHRDGRITHALVLTHHQKQGLMMSREDAYWHSLYQESLTYLKPDLVMYYGGFPADLLIPQEARMRGIPSAAYVVNGNYHGIRWCHDTDLILTDSEATAQLYKTRSDLTLHPVGTFIDPKRVVATDRTPERVLFVTPKPEKGAYIVAALALIMADRRPDITFEVVNARGDWNEAVQAAAQHLGKSNKPPQNVVVTPNTQDMRPVYGRAKVLLAPSLWWESGARVLCEAALNELPVIATTLGGTPEILGDAGIFLELPSKFHQKPHKKIPKLDDLEKIISTIERLYDDVSYYDACTSRTKKLIHSGKHSLDKNTDRLIDCLMPLLNKRAGDIDSKKYLLKHHKHGAPDLSASVPPIVSLSGTDV
ncbi:glycosyltransferase [Shimia abyssi]|uniref:Glycosyltransferase involved in cell wall biosynthesis n=1 Tax=Shimia abyssi TaxID=1662395 RepID=A0A2P8F768_9RHOB|nr:glycosyltransferase [Shimia abyssi]PSL17568.1 glycosyltransferase involved in cell wall biosynthesis [Shimia abyssi]